ncbi:GntP family gluconate:H+ symporter [Streptomyces sp. LBL]|uniref:GntP family permease n=1 Tax=Streptomyces sp. LBL TaxID=2940562 RepID=UPI002474D7F5|nr:SLC13 family permease [Streptomyces sp. LBL]MDH6622642.1 GntP family gluconate:H+ symporter [Streptomyces sp. LBL]
MSDTGILLNTAIAVIAIVFLIVRLRMNPVVALVLGSCYLGLATGLGVEKTVETISKGFGDVMADIGLLIAFGVLIGALLRDLGAIERLVDALLRTAGPKRIPHAMALTIATFLQSIYLDVLLVITGPLAKGIASKLGRYGTARMATALAIGLECGIVFTIPGVGALALAALLDVPFGKYLLFGLVVVIPTVTIAIAVMNFALTRGWWNPVLDEEDVPGPAPSASTDGGKAEDAAPLGPNAAAGATMTAVEVKAPAQPSLLVLFSPLLISLLLIATGALAQVATWHNSLVELLSSPVMALLLGLVATCVLARRYLGQPRVDASLSRGMRDSGQILLLNGVGGCLAGVIAACGLGDILGGYFKANTWAPLLIVWLVAAVLHIAVGSVTISAITAAGLLAPVAPTLGLDPVLIALAAGAGSLFFVHLTSNTFWLLQSLMGQTTRGTLKTCSVGVSVASVVAMGPILALSAIL